VASSDCSVPLAPLVPLVLWYRNYAVAQEAQLAQVPALKSAYPPPAMPLHGQIGR